MRALSKPTCAVAGLVCAIAAVAGYKPEPVQPLKSGPIAYFQAHCTRCHGPVDSAANTAFEKPMPEAELRKAVEDMAAGPGGAPLSGKDLDAEVALHQAAIAKRPFLDWTKADGRRLTGETLPGSVVIVKGAKGQVKAAVTGFVWTATPAKGDSAATVSVVATRNGKRATLVPARAAFTK